MIYKITFIVALWHCVMAAQDVTECTWCKDPSGQDDGQLCSDCALFRPITGDGDWTSPSKLEMVCGQEVHTKHLALGSITCRKFQPNPLGSMMNHLGWITFDVAVGRLDSPQLVLVEFRVELVVPVGEIPDPEKCWPEMRFTNVETKSSAGSIRLKDRIEVSEQVNGQGQRVQKIKFMDLTVRKLWEKYPDEPKMLQFELHGSKYDVEGPDKGKPLYYRSLTFVDGGIAGDRIEHLSKAGLAILEGSRRRRRLPASANKFERRRRRRLASLERIYSLEE